MAYKPSQRAQNRQFELGEPNITPMMNLMVVLIPLLLTSAEFVKLGIIEMNLPPAAVGGKEQIQAQVPEENQKKLDLAVTITDRGYFISSSLAVLSGEREGEPTIPLVNDTYNFDELTVKLNEIKEKARGRFPDIEQIILMAEPTIDYQTIVSTMDAARYKHINGRLEPLFPDVNLSAGIF